MKKILPVWIRVIGNASSVHGCKEIFREESLIQIYHQEMEVAPSHKLLALLIQWHVCLCILLWLERSKNTGHTSLQGLFPLRAVGWDGMDGIIPLTPYTVTTSIAPAVLYGVDTIWSGKFIAATGIFMLNWVDCTFWYLSIFGQHRTI